MTHEHTWISPEGLDYEECSSCGRDRPQGETIRALREALRDAERHAARAATKLSYVEERARLLDLHCRELQARLEESDERVKKAACPDCGHDDGTHALLGLGDSAEPCSRCPQDPDQTPPTRGPDGTWTTNRG